MATKTQFITRIHNNTKDIIRMSPAEIWTALLEIKGKPDGDHVDIEGAYVRAVVLAGSREDAIDLWRRGLDSMDFELLDVDECEQCVKNVEIITNAELVKLIIKAKRTRLPEFGAFHTWQSEDEESDV